METESVQVLWVKMKSYFNSVGPLTLYRLWPRHTHKEKVMWRWRQRAGWCVYKPRKHKACQQTHRSQGREESRHSLGSHREPTLPATWSCTSRSTTVTITFCDLDQTRRNQDRPPNKTPLPPKQHKHRKGRFLWTRRFCKRVRGCKRRTVPLRGWSSVRMPSTVDQCGPEHASSWWASPPCLLTSLTFETSAAFKVLIHFSSNQGHLSWEEKRARCRKYEIVACRLDLASWSSEKRPDAPLGKGITHPPMGTDGQPQEPRVAAVTPIFKCGGLSPACNNIFLAGSDLWISLICLTHTVNISESGLKAKTAELLLNGRRCLRQDFCDLVINLFTSRSALLSHFPSSQLFFPSLDTATCFWRRFQRQLPLIFKTLL